MTPVPKTVDLGFSPPVASEQAQLWGGMPEFVQEKQEPFAKIIIRFASAEDLAEFAATIGQPLTAQTKSIWHPVLIRGKDATKRYINDTEEHHETS